jgi:uncharacterized membrane protein YhaH (DUF805 family)
MPNASSIPPPAATAGVIPRVRVRDPDFWLEVVCWTVVAFCTLQILLFSFGRDQSIYAMVAQGILDGQMPYRDVWDFKPPGIFLVYALAHGLFGTNMLAPRLLEVAGLVGMVFAFRRLGDTFCEEPRAGLVGGTVAALLHTELEFWHTGQPESFGAFLIAYALVLATGDWGKRGRWFAWAGLGVLFGCAFVLKPTLGGGAVVCAAYLARRELQRTERWRAALLPVAVAAGASLLPIVACAGWFLLTGAWDALAWSLFEFAPGYTQLGWGYFSAPQAYYYGLLEAFFRFSALAAFGLIAAITMRPLHSREREGMLLVLGVIAVNVAGIAMQQKYFQYHYGATLPLIGWLAGLGLYKLWRRSIGSGVGGVVVFAAFVAIAVAMRDAVRDLPQPFWYRCAVRMQFLFGRGQARAREALDRELYHVADFVLDADRQVATEIRSVTAPDAPVYVWGFEPAIYWLSGRRPASRYIYNVPQRAPWERDRARAELLADLRAKPPALVAVQTGDVFPKVTGDYLDSRSALWQFPELSDLLSEQYRHVSEVSGFDLYERLADRPRRQADAKR